MPISIRNSTVCGGVYPLWLAIKENPSLGIVVYHRCSSYKQAGKGQRLLEEKARKVMREVENKAPRRVQERVYFAIEKGKLSLERPMLIEAALHAKKEGLMLVAADLSRFIRAEAYHHRENRNAFPTDKELDGLRELTQGVLLATLLPPANTESVRHSYATRRSPNRGRPSKANQKAQLILKAVELGMSPAEVANLVGVKKQSVDRIVVGNRK